MQKEFILKGLDCANCANKIETSVKSIRGVEFANVNFMTTTLKLTTNTGYKGNLFSDIEKVVHKYEPDIIIIEKEHAAIQTDEKKWEIIKLFAGAFIFGAGLILNINDTLKLILYAISYVILGGEVILRAVKNISKGQIFDENFLMCVATIGAFAIGEYPEAVAVMLFYQVGEYFQNAAVKKSRRSITDLMDIRPDYANPGEKIPLDGIVIEGSSSLDTKALTGESQPREVGISDNVISGCINLNGLLTVEVVKTYSESTVAKIMSLVENASSNKAPTENFITAFSKYYTPIIVVLAALIAVIPPVINVGTWSDWIHRGLLFLVISCPCALVISIPLGFFGGIGAASKRGILIKGGNFLDALNNLDIIVFDKTGTLTKGVFKVTGIETAGNFTKNEVLEAAAYAEAFSNHPIAQSIIKAFGKEIDKNKLFDYKETAGHGISVTSDGKRILAGGFRLMEAEHIPYDKSTGIGTKVYIAINNTYAGCVTISDEVKTDSRDAVSSLKKAGVGKTVMLTGDNNETGKFIADELQIDEFYAQLLPDQKVEILEKLEAERRPAGKLAYVGDGINDAPVLARADIGVAMGGLGSDAAIEAADIVLMTDEPSKLLDAIEVAKYTRHMHSITVRQEPTILRKKARELLALYIAAGLDPDKNCVYYQSHVPAHAELAWILNCFTYIGELNRMTQFKEKSQKHEENINAGLFTYPVLMAADILLFQTDLVPIGEDQKQHLELTRDVAIRFNNLYGDVFTIPEPYIPETGSRIMGLQEPEKKMSKSEEGNMNNVISLLDEPDVIINKFKRAVTDSDNRIIFADEKPGINNLLTIYSAVTGKTIKEAEAEFDGKGYGYFKNAVGETVVSELKPIQARFKELLADKAYIDGVIAKNAGTAAKAAVKTLSKEEEESFKIVKEFIYKNPNSTMADIVNETGIPAKRIQRFLREGRLEVTKGLEDVLKCEGCGMPIVKGKFCASCTVALTQKIDETFKREPVKEGYKSTGAKMHYQGRGNRDD
ncbi:cadmium/zinc-transporting atpase hma2-related [Holotrichia oblita]|nr:cadmium/zinc-transporting atpase hma2-related [Holotrichia oblita]